MAKPINLKSLTDEERGVLVEAIPLLRKGSNASDYYWEEPDFKTLYKKWLDTTNGAFAEGGFSQFLLAISQMRKTMPNTYKTTETNWVERQWY